MLLSIALFLHDPRSLASDVATYAGCALLASAFLTECYYWTVDRLNYPLMKLAITVLGVVTLAAATGVSKVTVNDATGQDPSYFTSAVALLVPLSFVPVAAAVVIVWDFRGDHRSCLGTSKARHDLIQGPRSGFGSHSDQNHLWLCDRRNRQRTSK